MPCADLSAQHCLLRQGSLGIGCIQKGFPLEAVPRLFCYWHIFGSVRARSSATGSVAQERAVMVVTEGRGTRRGRPPWCSPSRCIAFPEHSGNYLQASRGIRRARSGCPVIAFEHAHISSECLRRSELRQRAAGGGLHSSGIVRHNPHLWDKIPCWHDQGCEHVCTEASNFARRAKPPGGYFGTTASLGKLDN